MTSHEPQPSAPVDPSDPGDSSVPPESTSAPETFEEFWPHFLSSHRNPAVRWAHVAALGSLLLGLRRARRQRRLGPLLAGGAVAAALAVLSHPLLEDEWPQNLGRPGFGARAFVRLCLRTVTGRIEDDLAALDPQ